MRGATTPTGRATRVPSRASSHGRVPGPHGGTLMAGALAVLPIPALAVSGLLTPSVGVVAVVPIGFVFLSEALLPLGGRRPLMSMRPLVGILATYMLYVGPVITLAAGPWLRFVQAPPDFSEALDTHLVVLAVGAVIYKAVVSAVDNRPVLRQQSDREWSNQAFWTAWCILVIVSFASTAFVSVRVGIATAWLGERSDVGAETAGLGVFVFVADWLPLLFGIGAIVSYVGRRGSKRLVVLQLSLVALMMVVLLGWRGSRGSIIWPLLSLVVFWVLLNGPLRKRTLVSLLVFLGFLMVALGYFKVGGVDTLVAASTGQDQRAAIETSSGRGVVGLLRGDLDRTSAQVLLVSRLQAEPMVDLALGSTYLMAPLELLPDFLGISLPQLPSRGELTSSIVLGQQVRDLRSRTSRAFGMQGEAYINFGPAGAAAVLGVYALFVAFASRSYRRAILFRSKSSALVTAALTAPCLNLLPFELDVALGYAVKITLPMLLLALASRIVAKSNSGDPDTSRIRA